MMTGFGDVGLDLVVTWMDNPDGKNRVLYAVGRDLGGDGTAAAWSESFEAGSDLWTGHESAGLGATCSDFDNSGLDDFVFSWVDNPPGENDLYYRFARDPSDGVTANWTTREAAGANKGIGFHTDGTGLASGEWDHEPGLDHIPETFFGWSDDPSGENTIYRRQEWNGRFSSHHTFAVSSDSSSSEDPTPEFEICPDGCDLF